MPIAEARVALCDGTANTSLFVLPILPGDRDPELPEVPPCNETFFPISFDLGDDKVRKDVFTPC